MSKALLAAALFVCLVAGCGGGGGVNDDAVAVQANPAPEQPGAASLAYPMSVVPGSLAPQPPDLREAAPAMLPAQRDTASALSPMAYTVWLRDYRNRSGSILLIEQGLPVPGPATQGFLSMSIARQ